MTTTELYEIFLACRKVNIDTRKIHDNDLFFGIKGENFDGNEYAIEALDKGACYAIVDNGEYSDSRCIVVEDTLQSLQDLARHHRKQLEAKIIALTGSNGKTTTKELIATLLSERYKVQYTEGNLNNHLGVPLTLLALRDETEIAIVEMGANHLYEIKALCEIALPEYGLITNIGKAHIGEFGGYDNIIKAKTELYDFLENDRGKIFYNDESTELRNRIEQYRNSTSYKEVLREIYQVEFCQTEPTIQLTLGDKTLHNTIHVNTPLGGGHNCENIRASICIAAYFGLDPKEIQIGLQNFEVPSNRSQWIKTLRNQIFLDAYNANPTSMEQAINYFDTVDGDKKCFIVGEMLELGEYSVQEHQKLYDRLLNSGHDIIVLGKSFKGIADTNIFYKNRADLAKSGKLSRLSDYKILVKASRGMALEKLVELL